MVIEFVNKGLIGILDLVTMGDSAKRNDNSKIGEYASGLKYAICGMLRNKIPFRIFRGNKEIIISTNIMSRDDKKTEIVTVNGGATSFSIEMGHKWEKWMFIREIYSNCIDENGSYILDNNKSIYDCIPPNSNETKVCIEICDSGLNEVIENWGNYFADRKEVLASVLTGNGKILIYKSNQKSIKVYKKGIKVYEEETHSLFDYGYENAEIDEMRLLRNNYDLNNVITEAWCKCDNINLIVDFIKQCNNTKTYESKLQFTYHKFSNAWKEAIKIVSNIIPLTFKERSNNQDSTPVTFNLIIGLSEAGLLSNTKTNELWEFRSERPIICDTGLKYWDSSDTISYRNRLHIPKKPIEKLREFAENNGFKVCIQEKMITGSSYLILSDKQTQTIYVDNFVNEDDMYWQFVRAYHKLTEEDNDYSWKLLSKTYKY